jgi:hypothetical protein
VFIEDNGQFQLQVHKITQTEHLTFTPDINAHVYAISGSDGLMMVALQRSGGGDLGGRFAGPQSCGFDIAMGNWILEPVQGADQIRKVRVHRQLRRNIGRGAKAAMRRTRKTGPGTGLVQGVASGRRPVAAFVADRHDGV